MFVFLDKVAQSQAAFNAIDLISGTGGSAYNTGDRLIYQTSVLNPGGHYNNITGEYTCPMTGVYQFVYSINGAYIKQGGGHSRATATLYVDGDMVSEVYYSNGNSANTYLALSHTDIVSCQAGQRVWAQSDGDRNFILSSTTRNVFRGVLLYTT